MNNLELQQICFNNIKTLCSNYNKDSSSRKTEEYLNKRLESLQSQWQDFEERNFVLEQELENKNINYFMDGVFEKTKKIYEETKTNMENRLRNLQEQKQNLKFDLTMPRESESGQQGQHLLNKQECNFNAIDRVMSKIDLSLITEKWELDDYLSILKSKWEAIDKLHWEIDFLLKGTNDVYYDMFTNIENKYDQLKKKINTKMWTATHYQQSAPKIEIPEFSGSYQQWISFKNLFSEAIHNNPIINPAQKMQHLKSKLRGEPERLVQHLSISAENYISCWEILSQRYDNRRRQFSSFMNNMLNLHTIQQPDAYNLKKMYDVITESLNGINNIGIDTSSWDPMVVHIMSLKLDTLTYQEYMKELQDHRELQNLNDFLYFLESKFLAYETMKSSKKEATIGQRPSVHKAPYRQNYAKNTNLDFKKTFSKSYHTSYGKCPCCDGNHVVMQCTKFINMNTFQRNNTIAKLQLCKNCLFSHGNEQCKSAKTCKECNMKHHTLLHNFERKNNFLPSTSASKIGSTAQQPSSNHLSDHNTEILLTTALLRVKSINGDYVTLRALLDQGSQVNLITENAAQLLQIPRRKLNATISGVGNASGDCRGQINLSCSSIHSDYSFETSALIMKKLINNLPNETFEKTSWPHLENLKLADPEFNISRPIDLLLGADVYSEIILDGVLKGDNNTLVAQNTQIGYIICGKFKTFNCHVTLINMDELTKFWESEDIHNSHVTSKEDRCEKFYKDTVQRGSDGRYIVKMPLSDDFEDKIGESKKIAISQFLQLEKRFEKNHLLNNMYKEFIQEYKDLGHMKLSSPNNSNISCYLPHHGVLKLQSTTTKLRVVFNASQKNSTGYNLNDLLEKGPNLQKDIQSLIIKWRTYQYVFTADIEKMYRCIWLNEDQQNLQKIIWRSSPNEILQEYQLCTVTYGMKSSPWLAMRTLQQLAIDDGPRYSANADVAAADASEVLKNDFYMDDLISGTNSLQGAINLQQDLINLMKGGGMNLRKWLSNHPALLENLQEQQISTTNDFDFKAETASKTLGLRWNHNTDSFHFNWPETNSTNPALTKRMLLSDISKFYDPLGWLSPITITTKLMFQKLWLSKLGWDDKVPTEIKNDWVKLQSELPLIKNITLSRWIGETQKGIELLGFCDASEKAYACIIYTRTINHEGQPKITFLTSRTRVAPVAQKITLPKLELCGAVLLADLMTKVTESLKGYKIEATAWCDSQVVLAWINGNPNKWNVYVANRVRKINAAIPASRWRYVKTELNPADCATRGLTPSKLKSCSLWWNGPAFLTDLRNCENIPTLLQTNMGLINHIQVVHNNNKQGHDNFIRNLLEKYSSLLRVIRITSWVKRFITNTRNKKKLDTAYLTTSEMRAANDEIIKYIQQQYFFEEYKTLSRKENITKTSPIYKLDPYIDEQNIIRVGGRLKYSNLPLEMKYPIIVPHSGRFTELLIQHNHIMTLHGGARLTLNYTRQRYWIIGGNRAVKTQLRRCVRCHRFKASDTYQKMGNLPIQRITPGRPFTHTAIDYSGHYDIKLNKGRGVATSKAYIAVFICMTTKATHIELVSDLSTTTFIAALQRFCSRRGTPKHMYSDCGTNFVGASKVLRQEYEEFKQILTTEFFDEIAKMDIEWHFNVPAYPSAGGLWEGAVKSTKYHLRRVLGEQKLTFEEFTTLLAKIEACLNSRPLTPLTEDPDEFFNCLTPGHFLTGSPTLSLPLSDYNDASKLDLRKRWQLVEHIFHQYWKNWSNDYLTQLQIRRKWNKPTKNIKEGDIVLVREDNLPPAKWAMARVIQAHPGSDGLVRVTTLKTQNGVIKRPVLKLSPLPIEDHTPEQETATESSSKTTTMKKELTKKNDQRKTGNKTLTSALITLLSMFTFITGSYCTFVGTSASSAVITKLESERPAYYDTVGKMQTIHDEWILVMYYNLTNYWDNTNRIKTYYEHVKSLCEQAKLKQCMATMEQLDHEVEMLNHYNSILINPHQHLGNRKKRGLINGVGSIANTLFGILDQGFADKYQQDIKSLQANENYLLQLVKNQTSIVELENKVLKKTEENVKRQFKLIDSYIMNTNIKLSSIENELQILAATTYVNSASLTAYLLLNSMRKVQDMLFNTLTNVYQGHIDVHLVSPTHLAEQLTDISGRLPRMLSLPADNLREDIMDFYKLTNVKARVTENFFLFEVHIPLKSTEEFNLYKVIPLPVKSKTGHSYIRTRSKYFAVDLTRNTYISMSREDYDQCTRQKRSNILCNKNLPIYNLHNNNAPCEAKLLSHQNELPCNVEQRECKDEWIELHSPNSWLVICCDSCVVRIICDKDISAQTMTSSIIITLPQGCLLQANDMTIAAHNQYNSNVQLSYEFSIPTINTTINKIVNLKSRTVPAIFVSSSAEIARIEERITDQKKFEDHLPATVSTHDIHQYVVTYILVTAAIVTGIVIITKKYCSRRRRLRATEEAAIYPRENIELRVLSTKDETAATSCKDLDKERQPKPSRRVTLGAEADNCAFNFNDL